MGGCTDLLRSLALTGSVLGAQLRRGGRCEVLIEQGVEISDLPIVGAWGQLVDEHAKGEALSATRQRTAIGPVGSWSEMRLEVHSELVSVSETTKCRCMYVRILIVIDHL